MHAMFFQRHIASWWQKVTKQSTGVPDCSPIFAFAETTQRTACLLFFFALGSAVLVYGSARPPSQK